MEEYSLSSCKTLDAVTTETEGREIETPSRTSSYPVWAGCMVLQVGTTSGCMGVVWGPWRRKAVLSMPDVCWIASSLQRATELSWALKGLPHFT